MFMLDMNTQNNKQPFIANTIFLRKEVIQPHLPIRLPCYDFTLVIGFALGGSFPEGLGHRRWAPPTSMV
jgi:hypothetical protein